LSQGKTMRNQIRWQVFLNANSREKADRLLQQFARALGQEIAVLECERYWKDKSLFRATFTSPLVNEDCLAAVSETLQFCWRIARSWTIGAPQTYDGGRWEFLGGAAEKAVLLPGVTEVDFQAGNLGSCPPVPASDDLPALQGRLARKPG
jgi:hypothetical protein